EWASEFVCAPVPATSDGRRSQEQSRTLRQFRQSFLVDLVTAAEIEPLHLVHPLRMMRGKKRYSRHTEVGRSNGLESIHNNSEVLTASSNAFCAGHVHHQLWPHRTRVRKKRRRHQHLRPSIATSSRDQRDFLPGSRSLRGYFHHCRWSAHLLDCSFSASCRR